MIRRAAAALLLAACLPAAAAAQTTNAIDVPIADGTAVHVEFSDAAGGLNPELAAAYVGFLDSIPHGAELSRLRLRVASPEQIAGLCGGLEGQGILACYEGRQNRMNVPNVGLDATTRNGAFSLRYVLTHEYGHHIANHRSNAGFRGGSLDWGPKRWASAALVCEGVRRRQLVPGDEGRRYRDNPGENWAEAYARLTFPDQPWTFSARLAPDPATLDAARRDVVEPWTANATARFALPAGARTRRFAVPMSLDGGVRIAVRGPRRSEVGVRATLGGRSLGASRRKGRRDRLARSPVCRRAAVEELAITAVRTGNRRGLVSVTVSYPG
jgi:hypothetical protein